MDGLFLVLEPGNHMYIVIEAARRMGLTVVACHSQPLSPPAPYDRALPSISEFLPIASWRDSAAAAQAIIAWCGQRPVRGTYAGYEVTLTADARLRQHYGLPGGDPDKVELVLNKARVRGLLQDASLTRLRFVEDDALRRLSEWPFPGRAAFLKPVHGTGSIYVRRCTSLSDVRDHLAEWDGNARHLRPFATDHLKSGHGLFLEEEAAGELLSVEGYCYRGRYVPLGITDRAVLARDVAVEMGSVFPCPHPRHADIVEKARAIHELLGIDHGPTHMELIVPPDGGDVELVELNLRFGGGEILFQVNHAFDLQFEDDLVALAVGDAPATAAPPPTIRFVCEQDFLAPAHIRQFDAIEIPGDDIFFKKIIPKPGAVLKSTNFQSDYVATLLVAADTYADVLARANEIRAAVTINGQRLGNDPNNVVITYADRWTSSP